jgi:hypothetical protein
MGAALLAAWMSLPVSGALAAGECCARGNLAAAGDTAGAWSVQLQYEYSFMETLREGTASISPDEVLDRRIAGGAMKYSVPTEMVMQKYVLAAQAAVSPVMRLTASVPYVVNDMDMRMAMPGAMGMTMKSDAPMATVEGFGDVTVGALYALLPAAPGGGGWDAAAGLALKLPTGKNDVKKEGSEALVHAMMQPGTGSWDPIFTLQGGRVAGPLAVRLAGSYHLATRGDEGYEVGDMLTADLVGRYRVASALRLGLGLNLLHSGRDTDHDGRYTNPTSLIDTTGNTGLTAVYLTPELQLSIPGTGASLTIAYQRPIAQDVNGTQQVMDWRVLASAGWSF